ncbi:MAG: amidohydrolase, partial [Deltaproteobacteria bacterium CG_4_9_14_0_2_um_filter_42_21]
MKKETFTIALVQLTSTDNIEENVKKIHSFIKSASQQNVDLISFPENCFFMRSPENDYVFQESLASHYISQLQKMAKEQKINIHVGSFPQKKSFSKKHYNSSFIIHDDGVLGPVYRKIHLFTLYDEAGEQHNEASTIACGKKLVLDEVAGWRIGLSICYDLRFPELYRSLSKQGVDLILVPSAFVVNTG